MKLRAIFLLIAIVSVGPVQAMMQADGGVKVNHTQLVPLINKVGKLDVVHASASRVVIDGVTYAYNPLTTVVMVNGTRSTISDVRVGEILQFQSSSQGASQPELLTIINVQRK